ncbi:MAG: PfkB family carbohydrate kinase [Gammaproteobacteria bacterium]|jgi:fructokinase|nr:PfkB family carbohydrate kinase [Gammaproteobacteria bacterium]
MKQIPENPPLVFGEVLFDRFPDGSSVLGGAPFNVAWHLQAFGRSPVFVSRVGQDAPGRRILASMESWGMSPRFVQRDAGHPTGAVDVIMEGGSHHFDIVADSAWDYIGPDDIDCLPAAGLLYHGSLVGRSDVSRATLASLKRQTGLSTFIDVNLRDPWWDTDSVLGLLRDSRWVKLNDEELRTLAPERHGIEAGSESLQALCNIDTLFVTLGGEGAFVRTKAGETFRVGTGAQVSVVDTVGAGDAFASVLLLGLGLGWGMQTLLDRAQSFASAIVGMRGATVDDEAFYQPFIDAWGLS